MGDFTEWWWNVAMQGVIGSVISAVAAVGILLATVRVERHRRQEEVIAADTRAAIRATVALQDADPFNNDREHLAWRSAIDELATVAGSRDPFYSELVSARAQQVTHCLGRLMRQTNDATRRAASDAVGELEGDLRARLRDPKAFRGLSSFERDRLLGVARTFDAERE